MDIYVLYKLDKHRTINENTVFTSGIIDSLVIQSCMCRYGWFSKGKKVSWISTSIYFYTSDVMVVSAYIIHLTSYI